MSSNNKALKVPEYDGNRAKFMMYWACMEAYAQMRGLKETLKDKPEADLPAKENTVLDLNKLDEKKQIDVRHCNDMLIAIFMTSFKKDKLLRLIFKSKSADWPSSLAWKVVKGLIQ